MCHFQVEQNLDTFDFFIITNVASTFPIHNPVGSAKVNKKISASFHFTYVKTHFSGKF